MDTKLILSLIMMVVLVGLALPIGVLILTELQQGASYTTTITQDNWTTCSNTSNFSLTKYPIETFHNVYNGSAKGDVLPTTNYTVSLPQSGTEFTIPVKIQLAKYANETVLGKSSFLINYTYRVYKGEVEGINSTITAYDSVYDFLPIVIISVLAIVVIGVILAIQWRRREDGEGGF